MQVHQDQNSDPFEISLQYQVHLLEQYDVFTKECFLANHFLYSLKIQLTFSSRFMSHSLMYFYFW